MGFTFERGIERCCMDIYEEYDRITHELKAGRLSEVGVWALKNDIPIRDIVRHILNYRELSGWDSLDKEGREDHLQKVARAARVLLRELSSDAVAPFFSVLAYLDEKDAVDMVRHFDDTEQRIAFEGAGYRLYSDADKGMARTMLKIGLPEGVIETGKYTRRPENGFYREAGEFAGNVPAGCIVQDGYVYRKASWGLHEAVFGFAQGASMKALLGALIEHAESIDMNEKRGVRMGDKDADKRLFASHMAKFFLETTGRKSIKIIGLCVLARFGGDFAPECETIKRWVNKKGGYLRG
jgi:hypothetical protein